MSVSALLLSQTLLFLLPSVPSESMHQHSRRLTSTLTQLAVEFAVDRLVLALYVHRLAILVRLEYGMTGIRVVCWACIHVGSLWRRAGGGGHENKGGRGRQVMPKKMVSSAFEQQERVERVTVMCEPVFPCVWPGNKLHTTRRALPSSPASSHYRHDRAIPCLSVLHVRRTSAPSRSPSRGAGVAPNTSTRRSRGVWRGVVVQVLQENGQACPPPPPLSNGL